MVSTANAAIASDVRGEIVAAATRLFAAHGFDATPLQAIADAVGVTKPAVLHHFPSKDHIRRAVLDAILGHWNGALPKLLLAATASEGRFDTVFGELFRFFAEKPDRARLILREALDRPAEIRKLLRGPVRPWLTAVAGYIEAGKRTGRHFDDVDPEAYLVQVVQLVLVATAASDLTHAALDDDDSEKRESKARADRELARMAKASLFKPRTDGPRGVVGVVVPEESSAVGAVSTRSVEALEALKPSESARKPPRKPSRKPATTRRSPKGK